jgi:hypothetical protein
VKRRLAKRRKRSEDQFEVELLKPISCFADFVACISCVVSIFSHVRHFKSVGYILQQHIIYLKGHHHRRLGRCYLNTVVIVHLKFVGYYLEVSCRQPPCLQVFLTSSILYLYVVCRRVYGLKMTTFSDIGAV